MGIEIEATASPDIPTVEVGDATATETSSFVGAPIRVIVAPVPTPCTWEHFVGLPPDKKTAVDTLTTAVGETGVKNLNEALRIL